MSWDIFIQSIPKKYKSMEEIPEGFEPKPLCTHAAAVKAVRKVLPGIVFEQGFAAVESDSGSVEIDIGLEDPVMCVLLACRGDEGVVPLVCALVDALGGRAFDTSSDTGIFDPDAAVMSLGTANAHRDKVVSAAAKAPSSKPRAKKKGSKKTSKKAATKKARAAAPKSAKKQAAAPRGKKKLRRAR